MAHTNKDVRAILVLLVPSLAVFNSHFQHCFIQLLNVFYIPVNSNNITLFFFRIKGLRLLTANK